MSDMRKRGLAAALNQIEEQVGHASKRHVKDGQVARYKVFSTGSLALDVSLGCGGLPAGRFVEVYGGESAGKTTLCLTTIARAQARGATCAYIDAEHALDPAYAMMLGVDLEALVCYSPDTAEQAFSIAEILITSGAVDVIVCDSAAALLPKAEALGIADSSGVQAQVIGNALKKITPLLARSNCLFIFTNQIRDNFNYAYDGEAETTPCGHAMKHYMSVRLALSLALPDPKKPIPGVQVTCNVVKNKVGPPTNETTLFLNRGFIREYELTDLGRTYGVLAKAVTSGPLMFGDKVVGNSTGEAREAFKADPALAEEIETAIRVRAELNGDLVEFPGRA